VPRGQKTLALRLIDYDGMHIPALRDAPSGEMGHVAYQHPRRKKEEIYSAEVDRFSHLTIYCAIHCLTVYGSCGRSSTMGTTCCSKNRTSPTRRARSLFRTLWQLPDAGCRALVGRLALACQRSLEEVPLLEELTNGQIVR